MNNRQWRLALGVCGALAIALLWLALSAPRGSSALAGESYVFIRKWGGLSGPCGIDIGPVVHLAGEGHHAGRPQFRRGSRGLVAVEVDPIGHDHRLQAGHQAAQSRGVFS